MNGGKSGSGCQIEKKKKYAILGKTEANGPFLAKVGGGGFQKKRMVRILRDSDFRENSGDPIFQI
jgi:hypothetical protein